MSTALHAALLTPSGQHAIITPPADGSDRPLVRAAAILAALTAVAMTAYLLVIAAHDVPYVVRARLATLAAVLVVLTGATLITLAALRVQRRQRADDLATLREHLDEQVKQLGQRLGEVEKYRAELLNAVRQQTAASQAAERRLAALQAGVGEFLGRLEAVEQRAEDVGKLIKEHTGFARAVLAQLDRIESAPERLGERLEAVEGRVDEQDAVIADAATAESILARVNGHGQVHQLHPPDPRRSR